jgi:hypothetical protein
VSAIRAKYQVSQNYREQEAFHIGVPLYEISCSKNEKKVGGGEKEKEEITKEKIKREKGKQGYRVGGKL